MAVRSPQCQSLVHSSFLWKEPSHRGQTAKCAYLKLEGHSKALLALQRSLFYSLSVCGSGVISLQQLSLRIRPHQTDRAMPHRMTVSLTAHLSMYLSKRKQSFSTVTHLTGQIQAKPRRIWHQTNSLPACGICTVNENTGNDRQSVQLSVQQKRFLCTKAAQSDAY